MYARAKKDKFQKIQEKDLLTRLDDKHNIALNELKTILIDKLMKIAKDQVSQGVKSIYGEEMIAKGTKLTNAILKKIDFVKVDYSNWTKEEDKNQLISQLLHNYNIKVSEEVGRYKREKFNISIGDELPTGVLKLAKVYRE